jgi:hypothetical protein
MINELDNSLVGCVFAIARIQSIYGWMTDTQEDSSSTKKSRRPGEEGETKPFWPSKRIAYTPCVNFSFLNGKLEDSHRQ